MQGLPVRLLKEEYEVPQYLHWYLDFSLPSYSSCFPLPGPRGERMHGLPVRLGRLEYLVPQFLQ